MTTINVRYSEDGKIVREVIEEYTNNKLLFTAYNVWQDVRQKVDIGYDDVKRLVEDWYFDETHNYDRHAIQLSNPDTSVGKSGPAQVYHPIGTNFYLYDPAKFVSPIKPPPKMVSSGPLDFAISINPNSEIFKKSVDNYNNKIKEKFALLKRAKNIQKKGLFKFNVWFNGILTPCNFIHRRNYKGHFQKANDFEANGFLDDGTSVQILQDEYGKLYALRA